MMVRMKTIMKLEDLKTIDQLSEFLSGTQAVAFSIILDKDECYRWIQGALYKFHYRKLGKQDKGVLIRYLMKISQSYTLKLLSLPVILFFIAQVLVKLDDQLQV